VNQYEVEFQPWDRSWCLSGPVGANGKLLFQSARDAASYARWDAKTNGGMIKVYAQDGNLFKIIEIDVDHEIDDGLILPSV